MAGFGGMGGASFPARYSAPQSQTVDYLGDAGAWQTDWQARYDAEEARRKAPTVSYGPSREEYIQSELSKITAKPSNNVLWQPQQDVPTYTNFIANVAPNADRVTKVTGGSGNASLPNQGQTVTKGGGNPISMMQASTQPTSNLYFGDVATGEQVARQTLGNAEYERLLNYQPTTTVSGGYTPDFTALSAEKDRLQPRFEAQATNTQAYNNMLGNGQIGGILGPDYTLPEFGQVTGDFGQTNMGANAQQPAGVDMGWSNGAYQPGKSQQAGVYAPNPYNTIRWGL